MCGTRRQDADSCNSAKQHRPGMQATQISNLVSISGSKGFEACEAENCGIKLPAKWGSTATDLQESNQQLENTYDASWWASWNTHGSMEPCVHQQATEKIYKPVWKSNGHENSTG